MKLAEHGLPTYLLVHELMHIFLTVGIILDHLQTLMTAPLLCLEYVQFFPVFVEPTLRGEMMMLMKVKLM